MPSLEQPPPLQEVRRDAAHIVQTGLAGSTPADAAWAADQGAAAGAADAVAAKRPALERAFAAFANSSAAIELDSFRCQKLAREAGLLGPRLTPQQLDLLFARAKERGARR